MLKKLFCLSSTLILLSSITCEGVIAYAAVEESPETEEMVLNDTDIQESFNSNTENEMLETEEGESLASQKFENEEISSEEVENIIEDTIEKFTDETFYQTNEEIELTENMIDIIDEETEDLISGTFGTSRWTIDENGLLSIGEGTFESLYNNSYSPWLNYKNMITQIEFLGPVTAKSGINHLFDGLSNVTEIRNIDYLDTSGTERMMYVFKDCSSLTHLDLSGWDTKQAITFTSMFNGCSNIVELDLSNFNTSSATSYYMMFVNCPNLKTLDISSFGEKTTASAYDMFDKSAINLSSIKLGQYTPFHRQDGIPERPETEYLSQGWIGLNTNKFYRNTTLFTDLYDGSFPDTYVWAAYVNVDYINETGDKLHESDKIYGALGNSYDITNGEYQVVIPGYHIKEANVLTNLTGQFIEAKQTITYVYTKDAEQGGDITVEYRDASGKEILDSKIIKGKVGESYDVSTQEYQQAIEGYTLDKSNLPTNMTGKFTEKAQTVTYVYTKNEVQGGDITVEYVDTLEKELLDAKVIEGKVGKSYDVSTKEYQQAIEGYTLDESNLPTNMTGEFTEKAQTVTYVYTKDVVQGGDVTVKYMNSSGKELSDSKVVEGNIGESYDVSTKKYQQTIEGYTLDESNLPTNMIGEFTEKTQTVIYVYIKDVVQGGAIEVKYIDSSGKGLSESKIIEGNVGESYDVTMKEYQVKIEGYTLDESNLPTNMIGEFTEKAQTVTYIYKKNEVQGGDITVKYVNSSGEELLGSKAIEGNVGETYDVSTQEYQQAIEGYTLDESDLPTNMIGKFTEKAQTVTYVYKKNEVQGGDIAVKYVDASGEKLSESKIVSGKIGKSYDVSTKEYQVEIEGYTLDESNLPTNMIGEFTKTAQTVTYVYTKDVFQGGAIEVKYIDSSGKELSESKIIEGNVGESYDVSTEEYQKVIEGYTLDENNLPTNMIGEFTKTAQTVIYVYLKDVVQGGAITVKYVDSLGKELLDSKVVEGDIGESYDVSTEEYQQVIEGYTLDENNLPANITGEFTEKTQIVTYVYTKDVVQGGDITVKYIDASGEKLSESKIVEGNIGESYDVSSKKYQQAIAGYTLDESNLPTNMTGEFTEKAQTVTYVYTKNEVQDGNIRVEYVDVLGKELLDTKVIEGKIGESYDVSTKEYRQAIEGYTLDESNLPTNMIGEFTEKAQIITYVYTKNEVQGRNIRVEYVDVLGKELLDAKIIEGKVGESYDVSTKEYQQIIEGYTLDKSNLPMNMIGEFTGKTQTVTYVYTKDIVQSGEIIIEYVDTSGKKISESKVVEGKVDENYDVSTEAYQPVIEGYSLDEHNLPTNITGKFTKEIQMVTYIYRKDQNLAVKDENKIIEKSNELVTLSKSKVSNVDDGRVKLPQTGDSKSILPIIIGLQVIVVYIWVFLRNKKS